MAQSHNPSVQIRMYRQGLGDCFLLTFREDGKDEYNMLIDCGLLQGTTNGKEIMRTVVADIDATLRASGQPKARLDAVVLTHEHADHISGFGQAKDLFEKMEFGEVWAGWMDDEAHPQYKAVRERFKKQITGLKAAVAQMDSNEHVGLKQEVEFLLNEFFEDDVLGAAEKKKKGRSPAWEFAMSHSAGRPRFCTPGMMFPLPGFEDIRVYILGPSEDFESFTRVNPPEEDTYREEGKAFAGNAFALMDSFFAAVGGDDEDAPPEEAFQPFEKRSRMTPEDAQKQEFFQKYYGFYQKPPSVPATAAPQAPGAAVPPGGQQAPAATAAPADEEPIGATVAADKWRRIESDWLSMVGNLALNLDTYTNNTCLAFAIEFISSKKVLLFPGDAQFSNWLSWQKLTWEVPGDAGTKEKIKAKDLLEHTVFYKVGHHGSHNATLKKHGLEMMTSSDLVAMVPVDRKQAASKTSKTNPKGWEMPEKKLFERLLERTRGRVILADESEAKALKERCNDQKFIDSVKFLGAFKRTDGAQDEPLCIELTIDG